MLPEGVVETAPEVFVLFSFDNGKDILFGGFIGSVLRRVEAVLQVLPPVAVPMLPKVVTLLLTLQLTALCENFANLAFRRL